MGKKHFKIKFQKQARKLNFTVAHENQKTYHFVPATQLQIDSSMEIVQETLFIITVLINIAQGSLEHIV